MQSAGMRAIIAETLAASIGSENRLAAERHKCELELRGAESVLQEQRRIADVERRKWESALRTEREKWELLRAASETLRSATIKGVRDFHAQFEKQISAYRSERAWRIMLAIRKAYTLRV